MQQEYTKINDYTICENTSESSGGYSSSSMHCEARSLKRTFNFMAGQVTTQYESSLRQSRGGHAGGSAAVSAQMMIENFDDIQSTKEIEFMYNKLKNELGGNPPPLDEVLGGTAKKIKKTVPQHR